MCGILGLYHPDSIDRSSFQIQLALLSHRGPDASGIWMNNDCTLAFGHRRLSIIDLSVSASQPMQSPCGRFVIVFNGEIYNYLEIRDKLKKLGCSFRTESDTEVLLMAFKYYGKACLSMLEGMFAFAIWDKEEKRLLLARDPAGEKPLFWFSYGQIFGFASELKGLLAEKRLPKKIDRMALHHVFAYGYVPGSKCIFEHYHKLEQGHYMIWGPEKGIYEKGKFWKLPLTEKSNTKNLDELLNETQYLLEESVKKQIIADVPLGIMLSGGVDSSLVTAMAAKSKSCIKTFTVTFPDSPKHDESAHARLISDYFGTDHTEIIAEKASLDVLPLLAWHFDEPVTDPSIIPTYFLSKAMRKHCTVALGGDGADELFGGYHRYQKLLKISQLRQKLGDVIAGIASLGAEKLLPMGFKGRHGLMELGMNLENGLPMVPSLFNANEREVLLGDRQDAEGLHINQLQEDPDLLQRAMRTDVFTYMSQDILVKVDRCSMASSLEVRAPFLHKPLLNYAFSSIPSKFKVNGKHRKIILKGIAQKILPQNFDANRKQGFVPPLHDWFYSREKVTDVFETLKGADLFDTAIISRLQKSGNLSFNQRRVFALLLMHHWHTNYFHNPSLKKP